MTTNMLLYTICFWHFRFPSIRGWWPFT